MMRALLFGAAMILSAVFEYGFIHSLPWPFSLIPLGVTLALYVIFCLRPVPGITWMIFLGLVADVQAPTPVGEILVAALLGALMIFIVLQYVSHASWYAACLATVCVLILWDVLRAGLGFLGGVSMNISPVGTLWEALFGVGLVTVWFAVFPRLHATWNRRIRPL